jgi:hypothetical protein
MLNMKVLDYRITSDANQVTVNKVSRDENERISMTKDKDENVVEATSTVGWYPDLETAIKGIRKHYTLSSGTDIRTIADYRKALQEVEEAFENELEV